MRDPARIDQILDRIRTVWYAHPDWRLGQLLQNIGAFHRYDVFYIEDEDVLKRLQIAYQVLFDAKETD